MPSRRTVEVLDVVFGAPVSAGPLYNARAQCFEAIEPITTAIANGLQQATVEHFDETGLRLNAIDAMNILPCFQGKAVHDRWVSYGG